jgi:hypothetical protein
MAAENRQSALHRLGELPEDLSLKNFVFASLELRRYDHYKFFPTSAKNIINNVRVAVGDEGIHIYLRAALAHAVIDLIGSERFQRLPPRVSYYQMRHLSRIAADADVRADWLSIDHDLFHKEFGLATLRLYATGGEVADYRCGIPRSVIFAEGMLSAPRKLKLISKLGGFKPYFQLHMHMFDREGFTEHGRNECFRCCADLYSLHPDCLGMFGSSWYYDPALEEISPRLSYVRKIPTAGGGQLLFVGTGGDAIENSLATSPTRRKLYEDGKYTPTTYMLVWGKEAQIAWAKRSPS